MDCSLKVAMRARVELLCVFVASAALAQTPASPRRPTFLCRHHPIPPAEREATAAAHLVRQFDAVTIVAAGKGEFRNTDGTATGLGNCSVVWFHQGDDTGTSASPYDTATLKALREYVEKGNGLFLTGAALYMVHALGIETARPRLGGPGNDRGHAGLVPLLPKHPVFAGVKTAGHLVQISDAGYPAFSDFHRSGGPRGGMLLARSPGGVEHPFVEYALGKGRVIAMGWRLPHYSHAKNAHRANLERLTRNVVDYLATPKQWQKVVLTKPGKPAPVNKRTPDWTVSDSEWRALRMAIKDLNHSFEDRYPRAAEFLERLAACEKACKAAVAASKGKGKAGKELEEAAKQFRTLRDEALKANPILADAELLAIRRAGNLGLPANWQSNSSLGRGTWDNEIVAFKPGTRDCELRTVCRPDGKRFVGDVDLHFNGDRILFSMRGKNKRWQVFEQAFPDGVPEELPLIPDDDVDNYDACYLPDGNIVFTSTAPFVGVPCVRGGSHVSNLYLFERAAKRIRRLTFDQEHNWCPTVLNNGRVLYLRWEYSDLPHYVSRILFHMNPDGTNQSEYYGSNSYWPNSLFYARPIPHHPSAFVGIVTGHHGVKRMGELVLFDPALGRHEASGVIQRIPGYGKPVEPVIVDAVANNSWPKFLHPFPLADSGPDGTGAGKYFLVAAQPDRQSAWGIYLVDVFDNMVLLKEQPGSALLEPLLLRPTVTPPVIPPRVKLDATHGLLYVADVYAGPGLKDVPRGTVEQLRLVTYHFSYHGMGGQIDRVGLDGPWDVKRVLGTVPVEPDGSALFRVPANTPISMQPLDADGKAVALMRSWTTAMPGEIQSCAGCHEPQNTGPPPVNTIARAKTPAEITPWYGPVRGFSFKREVQPVLDAYCVRCHNGQGTDERPRPDLRARPLEPVQCPSKGYRASRFSPSYMALRAYLRTPTIESDMHLLPPYEFHASTSELIQMLEAGHHGVQLSREAWDRLITWIDLHAPAHGTWMENVGEAKVEKQRRRRYELMKRYSTRDDDEELVHTVAAFDPKQARPEPRRAPAPAPLPDRDGDGPVAAGQTPASRRSVALTETVSLDLVRIPRAADAGKTNAASVLWMGRCEVTNAQFAVFDISHDSRLEHGDFLQFGVRERGYPVNNPDQPVCRISFDRTQAFCRWLSERTGETFRLPTEAEWRRANAVQMWPADQPAAFAEFANLADRAYAKMDTFGFRLPSGAIPEYRPHAAVDDTCRVSAAVGSYRPNRLGLHDLIGNVWEWTGTPFPADDADATKRLVVGGAWSDRPKRVLAGTRLAYYRWQGVYNVGFRVVCEDRSTLAQR